MIFLSIEEPGFLGKYHLCTVFNICFCNIYTNMDILLLSTPAQHEAVNPAVEINARRLKRWITELPTNDIGETVRMLHDAIEPFSEQKMSNSERLKLLETYRNGCNEILFFFHPASLRQLPVTSAEQKSLGMDIIWILQGMANGYKTIIKNCHAAKCNPKRNSMLLLSIYRALEFITHALLYGYGTSQPPPPLAYLEVYQLYRFAEHFQVTDRIIKTISQETATPTIDRIFKQFMLLTIAGLSSLDKDKVFDLYMVLEPFAPYSLLGEYNPGDTPEGQYLFDFADDNPPHYCDRANMITPAHHIGMLDVEPALETIELWTNKPRDTEKSLIDAEEIRLLQAFLLQFEDQTWINPEPTITANQRSLPIHPEFSSALTQGAPYYEANREIKVAMGWDVFQYYSSSRQRLEEACAVEVYEGIEVRSLNSADEAGYEVTPWTILEENEQERLLIGHSSVPIEEILIGDVLGLIEFVEDKSQPTITLSIIRWKEGCDDGNIKLGVEIVPGRSAPVTCFAEESNNTWAQKYQGLYFPPDESLQRPATLFTHRELIEQDGDMVIYHKSKVFTVHAQNLLVESPIFAQFRFKVLNSNQSA